MSEKKYLTLIILLTFLSVCLNIIILANCCLVGGTTSFEVDVDDKSGNGIKEAEVKITDSDGDTIVEETADDSGILDVDNEVFEVGEEYTITAGDEDYNENSKTVEFEEDSDNTYNVELSEDEPKPTKQQNGG